MTISELLVRRGYWPTVIGPHSNRHRVIRGGAGTIIKLSAGTFAIDSPIELRGISLIGNGADTVIYRR